jgi:hypothetical protein
MIRGTKRALEKRPSIKANINASIHNRFDIEVVDAKTGEVKQRAKAENVICDYLWTVMFNTGTSDTYKWNQYIQYGTGSGTPSVADTSLFSYWGYGTPNTADDVRGFDEENRVASLRRKITLLETDAVNATITEVGISNKTSGKICTHAMLTDMNGNPVSILKTSSDIINIYATVFAHWSGENDEWFAFSTMSATGGGLLPWVLGLYNAVSARSTMNLTGNSGGRVYKSNPNYAVSLEDRTITFTYARVAASEGNNGGGGYSYINGEDWVMRINPKWYVPPRIVGEAIGTGDGVTKDFATTFRDVKDAVVYVDGVAVNTTVDPAYPLNPKTDIASALIPRTSGGKLAATNFGNGTDKNGKIYVDVYSGILENPHNDLFGIAELDAEHTSGSYFKISLSASDDMEHWTTIAENVYETVIPENLRRSRYFKMVVHASLYNNYLNYVPDTETGYNIHFAEAPADGAVITADYTPGTIAKDENHVFDFQITFTVGAYSPD